MTDLSTTVAPKSDQLNSDSLIGGPLTIKITKVSADPSSVEQPILINYAGDDGKPFKPCKSMRRCLINVWGKDGSKYVGRSMTLYRDPEVQFGGLKVGGIRISHVSHIDAPITMALTATRASRKPFTVKPLIGAVLSISEKMDEDAVKFLIDDYGRISTFGEFDALEVARAARWQEHGTTPDHRVKLKAASEAAKRRLAEMVATGVESEDSAGRGEQDETL
jgi:hypothetical protein